MKRGRLQIDLELVKDTIIVLITGTLKYLFCAYLYYYKI